MQNQPQGNRVKKETKAPEKLEYKQYRLESTVFLALEKRIAEFKKIRELAYYNENPKAYLKWLHETMEAIKEENYNSRMVYSFIRRYELYDLANARSLGEWNHNLFKRREFSIVHPDASFEVNFNYPVPLYAYNNNWYRLDTGFPYTRQRPSWTSKIEDVVNEDFDARLKFEINAFLSKLPADIVKLLNLKKE
jgi:hypothetical protein